MEITEVLERCGLNGKEASVYLALLELGTSSVNPVAAKAGIKRPTVYLVLDQLARHGLVSVVPNAKKALYTAESPERILSEMGKREELLKRFMPNLLALYNEKKEKPRVQLFEGKEGIAKVYQRIYAAKTVSFFGTVKEALRYDPDDLWEFVERTQREAMHVRDLLFRTPEDFEYAARARHGQNYQIRFLPESARVMTDNAIFGDSIAFFSFHPQIFAVVIESREIATAVGALYEFAWVGSAPLEAVLGSKKTAG